MPLASEGRTVDPGEVGPVHRIGAIEIRGYGRGSVGSVGRGMWQPGRAGA